jgi:hypothetical protein
MASLEGIHLRFRTQPLARSPKLRVYEYLHLLNQRLQETLQILQGLEKCPGLRRDFLRSFQIELEEVRAQANFEVIEYLSEQEQHDWARCGRLRRKWDKQFEDPDDPYISVERREEERKKKGLPPRVGVVPHSAVAAEERRLEAAQQRKKKHSRKHR